MIDRSPRTLILGLGNELLRDDGVGLAAARRVARAAGERADLAEACVATLDLLALIEGYDRVIVVDAYASNKHRAGTAVRADPDSLPAGFGYRSAHTLPFAEMLELGRRLEMRMPRKISIHGLCVQDAWTFEQAFTPPVENAWRPWADGIVRAEFA